MTPLAFEGALSKKWVAEIEFVHEADIERYRKFLITYLADTERAFLDPFNSLNSLNSRILPQISDVI